MKKNVILLFVGLLMGCFTMYSQVGVGTNDPHKESSIHVLVPNKGLILPKSINATALPKYNINEIDLYEDDRAMEGMLMYNEEIKGVSVYDGEKWESIKPYNVSNNALFSATKNSGAQVFACLVLACTPINPIIFNRDVNSSVNRASTTYDFSDMYNTSTGVATIKEDGYYLVNLGVGVVSNLSISLGNSYTNIQLQMSSQGSTYETIAEAKPRFDVLGLFNRSVGKLSKSVYLKKGDRVKVVTSLNLSVSLGIYNISTDPLETYFEMTKLM